MNILFIHEVDWLKKVAFDIHSLAEGLSLLGHQVYAIDYESGWRRNGFLNLADLKTKELDGISRTLSGAKVHLRRPGFIKIPALSRISVAVTQYLEIEKTIKEKAIDAIVLYSVPTNGLQVIYLAKKYKIPVLFRAIDILNMLVSYPMLRPATRLFEKIVYSNVDVILSLTPKLSEYVVGMGAHPGRIKPLLMPVDTNLFHPAPNPAEVRQKWGLSEKEKVIVFIGTLFDFSGLDLFIRQFPELLKRVPEARLLIVGDGLQRPKLESIIIELGLQKRIIITGFEPYEAMPQYINLATICTNTFTMTRATSPIFPGKIVQYLACGKAVVATALPGMKAVIQGEEQGVVYAECNDDIAPRMISLLESAEYRQRVGQAGLNYVIQTHAHGKVARELESILQQVVKTKMAKTP